ncbi:hypothetical protein HU001_02325 [Staphylococcus sp. SS21]|nr:hypothetical protein [Staphylococcus singaporensis]
MVENSENKYVVKIIGKDYIDGKLINTQWGTVHYSKSRSRIIPNGRMIKIEIMDLHW